MTGILHIYYYNKYKVIKERLIEINFCRISIVDNMFTVHNYYVGTV